LLALSALRLKDKADKVSFRGSIRKACRLLGKRDANVIKIVISWQKSH